jgi:malonyl-CoA/methylmalonyl-CoA synthetase
MYHRLIDAAADAQVLRGLKAARVLVSGSAPLPQRDHQRLEAVTGRRLLERYGLTETLINCSVRLEDPPMPGRVGRPLDGVELRLVDEQQQPLPEKDDTTIGELQVRGAHVFSGYLNRPEATAAVLDAEGWFSTGDLACQREDGSVRIVGRRSTDLIKCGGYKVGAGEVEAALLEHSDVREAAVLGMPDADLGERIVAFVVPSAPGAVSAPQLEQFVAALLSPHKRPREVRLVEALPRNAMGKVLKNELKKGLVSPP